MTIGRPYYLNVMLRSPHWEAIRLPHCESLRWGFREPKVSHETCIDVDMLTLLLLTPRKAQRRPLWSIALRMRLDQQALGANVTCLAGLVVRREVRVPLGS